MAWQIGLAAGAVVSASYLVISVVVFRALRATGQLWSNPLALMTGLIFLSCSAGHFAHVTHLAGLWTEPDVLAAARLAYDDHLMLADAATAIIASYYLTLRRHYGRLLDTGQLYEDLERARIEAEHRAVEESNRLKHAFLTTIGHELRTPMNGILGMTQLLVESDLSADQQAQLQLLERSSEHLLEIIDDVLDLAFAHETGVLFHEERMDLWATVEDSCVRGADRADARGLRVTCTIDADVPRWVQGDARRIRQMVDRLVDNAIRYTDDGWVGVELTTGGREDDVTSLVLTVTDTGPGIRAEDRDRLLEPFSRGEAVPEGGTGLGLPVCRLLAERMGGSLGLGDNDQADRGTCVRVELRLGAATPDAGDPPGRGVRVVVGSADARIRRSLVAAAERLGATVASCASAPDVLDALAVVSERSRDATIHVLLDDAWVTRPEVMASIEVNGRVRVAAIGGRRGVGAVSPGLQPPFRRTDVAALLATALPEAVTAPPRAGELRDRRVLIVEDNVVNQMVTRALVESFGCRPSTAENGRCALDRLEYERFDLVLMDCQMPVMDGYETTRAIRRMPGLQDLPVIALTAAATESDRAAAEEAGMDGYLPKPVEPERLRAAMASALATPQAA